MELIANHCTTDIERHRRTEIAKTLCYHRRYLNDTELRDGYEHILKQVEQGKLDWEDELGDKLHEYLDYRANVNMRAKVNAQQDGFVKVEYKKSANEKKSNADPGGKPQICFCLEYNVGNCPQSDHHEGRLGHKKVNKFHICRKCHREGEFKSHRESDEACPRKKSS